MGHNKSKEAMVAQDLVKELFDYDPEGFLVYKKRARSGVPAGSRAGSDSGNCYRVITINFRHYVAHRLIWLWHKGEWPVGQIDHINRKKRDNRIENLRTASESQNRANSKRKVDNTTGFKGVRFHGGRWYARIMVNGKSISLGGHGSPETAHEAYCTAAKGYFGDFANGG